MNLQESIERIKEVMGVNMINEQSLMSPDENESFINFLKDKDLKLQTIVSPNPYQGGDLKVELRANKPVPTEFLDLLRGVSESITVFTSDGKKIAQVVGSGTGDESYEGGVSVGTLDSTVETPTGFYRIIKNGTPFIEKLKSYPKGKENRVFVSVQSSPSANLKVGNFYKSNPAILVL